MHSPEQLNYRHSIQRRFFLLIALFLVVAMGGLGSVMFANQRLSMEARLASDTEDLILTLKDKGASASAFLARIAPQGLLAYDYLLLEGYVEELSADSDIVYAVIFNTQGEPVTHYLDPNDPYFGDQVMTPANYQQFLDAARADSALLIVRRTVEYLGKQLGSVEVALSYNKIQLRAQALEANLEQVLRRTAIIIGALLMMSLVALLLVIEWIFRRMVVKPIHALAASMARLQAGDLSARADILRDDEIGYLATRFNRMADDLRTQAQQTANHARDMQETYDYLANILDHSGDMIATTSMDGTLVQFNAAAERTLGYAREDIIGCSSDLIYCDEQQRNLLYAAVYEGRPIRGVEIQLRHRDGTPIDVELTLSPLLDNEDRLIGAVCIGRDVTHAKALRRELIQAEKMASIGQVAAWIAHQIRNYLGRLLMDAASLQPLDNDVSARRHAHADLTRVIGDMERLVTDLLDYSRNLELHCTPMRLDMVLDDLLAQLTAEMPTGHIRIERMYAAKLPPISVDVFKMEQAFSNVLRNAVQAMPAGGRLRVTLRVDEKLARAIIAVQDSGSGIPAADLEKVFRPFYTTRPGGTGLGLAMAQRIVQAHGGIVSAHNAADGGAVLVFSLPYALHSEVAA